MIQSWMLPFSTRNASCDIGYMTLCSAPCKIGSVWSKLDRGCWKQSGLYETRCYTRIMLGRAEWSGFEAKGLDNWFYHASSGRHICVCFNLGLYFVPVEYHASSLPNLRHSMNCQNSSIYSIVWCMNRGDYDNNSLVCKIPLVKLSFILPKS